MENARPIGNLSDEPQMERARFGLVALAVGLVLAVVLLKLGVPTAARLATFPPFFVAAFGLFQALHKT